MDVFGYRIVAESALAEDLQLHVFARAYRDAWIALHAQAPVGTHAFVRLGVTIAFTPEDAQCEAAPASAQSSTVGRIREGS